MAEKKSAPIDDEGFDHRMTESINDYAIVRFDPHGNILTWNDGAGRITGYSEEEVRGKSIEILYSPEDIAAGKPARLLRGARNTGGVTDTGWRRRRDGTMFFADVVITATCDRDRKLIGYTAITRDITRLREAEATLSDRHALSEEKNRAIVETVVDAIISVDESGIIDAFNPAACSIFGYSSAEVEGNDVAMLIAEAGQGDTEQLFRGSLQPADAPGVGRGRVATGRRKDGSEFPMELAVSDMTLDNRRMFIAVVRDVTQQKKIEHELRQTMEAAEAANIEKSQFLSAMSHELRTPLNAIIGYSELLAEEENVVREPRLLWDVQKILGAGSHLLSLINNILDLSKIDAGGAELLLMSVSVADLLDEVATSAAALVEKNENILTIDCDPGLDEIYTDATKLRQIIFNLLSNAAKFTTNGTIELTARRVKPGADAGKIAFSVRDSGIGMNENQLEHLFQPFTQSDSSTTREHDGTGLGLALSWRLAKLLGGAITVATELGHGSAFTLTLPGEIQEAPDVSGLLQGANKDGVPVIQLANRAPAVVDSSRTVIVIDDAPEARQLLTTHLENEGWNVVTAANAETGIRIARNLQPAAITLDALMPGIDGWGTLEVLKADPKTAHIPVVMCSILDDRNRGFALGVADFLVKPISRERLLSALQRYRGTRSGRLLIVEDDDATREMLARTARGRNWQVAEATDGQQALDSIAVDRPDLILLDLLMPILDGFGVVEALQRNPAWREIPVLVVTAKDLSPHDRERLHGHVESIIEKKGYSMAEVLAEITRRLHIVAD